MDGAAHIYNDHVGPLGSGKLNIAGVPGDFETWVGEEVNTHAGLDILHHGHLGELDRNLRNDVLKKLDVIHRDLMSFLMLRICISQRLETTVLAGLPVNS